MSIEKKINRSRLIKPALGGAGLLLLTALVAIPFVQPGPDKHKPLPTAIAVVSKSTLTAAPTSSPITSLLGVEQSILDNIKQNGFDSNKSINHGSGGLWINWRYGTQPLQTDFNGTGKTDAASKMPLRHDILTDIRYLHSLWMYKAQHPGDTRYDDQIKQYTPIVKLEYAGSTNPRGWLYDEELIDLYKLSNDIDYKNYALSLIQSYSQSYSTKVGSIYTPSSTHHKYGLYRVDMVMEAGCALVMAGTQFNNPLWVEQGKNTVNFLYTHAYVTKYHVFASQMDNVLLANGRVNPNETFLHGTSNKTAGAAINGNQFRMGEIAQIIISLLNTYQLTHDQTFLNRATDLLDAFSLPQNSLGIWDSRYTGYFFGGIFSGSGPSSPGIYTVVNATKEPGRQAIMLQAFHLADLLTNGKYQNMEQLMLNVALNRAYYTPGHGVLYLTNADWTLYIQNHVAQDWVTTEAMGAELEGLLSTTSL